MVCSRDARLVGAAGVAAFVVGGCLAGVRVAGGLADRLAECEGDTLADGTGDGLAEPTGPGAKSRPGRFPPGGR
jgi:hypothetical protein